MIPHLCRKVTRFYINLQRAGCQSARCLKPPPRPSSERTNKVSKWTLKYKPPKLLFGHYGFCIQLRPYSSLHYRALKYRFRNIFLPKILFFFLNCTLLQTTACNGVKHHRNNAGIQQKSSCLSATSNKTH